MPRILNLRCSCCGGGAPALEQWWNQDRGYGLCAPCAIWIAEKEVDSMGRYYPNGVRGYIEETYGRYGVHHSLGDN